MLDLFELFKIDYGQNFNTLVLEDIKEIAKNITPESLELLEENAKSIFDYKLYSVVETKNEVAKKYGMHEYVSMGLYWWPNPDTADGLPWIRKDGVINPECIMYNKDAIRRVSVVSYLSCILYILTKKQKYYDLMKKHIHYFYLNEDTKMNPRMQYTAMRPGIDEGRGTGILEFTTGMGPTLLLLKMIRDEVEDEEFFSSFDNWIKDFYKWINTSDNGIDERNQDNNHGTMYDLLCLSICYYLDSSSDISDIKDRLITRMDAQILEDGTMPQELERTRSLAYTMMNLKAHIDCQKIINHFGQTIENNKLQTAIDFMMPYLLKEKEWPYMQIEGTYIDAFRYYPVFILKHKYNQDIKFSDSCDVTKQLFEYYLFKDSVL